jgi:hypothetical protein
VVERREWTLRTISSGQLWLIFTLHIHIIINTTQLPGQQVLKHPLINWETPLTSNTVLMSSISSLLVGQLEQYGLPLQYATKVTGMFTGDILTLGIRLACVSLLAAFLKNWFYQWKHVLDNGKLFLPA